MACIQLSNMNYPTIRFIQICIPIWVCSRLEHTTYNSFLRSDHWGTPWSTGFGTAFRILPAQVGQMNAAVPISAFGVSSWFHPRCTLPSWPRLWWPMASICSQVGKLTVEGSGLPYVNIIYWYKLLVYYIYIIYMHINNEILISYMLTVNITILLPYIYIYYHVFFSWGVMMLGFGSAFVEVPRWPSFVRPRAYSVPLAALMSGTQRLEEENCDYNMKYQAVTCVYRVYIVPTTFLTIIWTLKSFIWIILIINKQIVSFMIIIRII